MNLSRTYRVLLRLYPIDYRASFAVEMLNAFECAAGERSRQGTSALLRFAFAELLGLLRSAGAEWMAKLSADRSIRSRSLPDLRMMRPPDVPREIWFAAARLKAGSELPARRRY